MVPIPPPLGLCNGPLRFTSCCVMTRQENTYVGCHLKCSLPSGPTPGSGAIGMMPGRFVVGHQTRPCEHCLRIIEVIQSWDSVFSRVEQVEPSGGDRESHRDVGEHAPFGSHPLDLRPSEGCGVHGPRPPPRHARAQSVVGRPGNGLPIVSPNPRAHPKRIRSAASMVQG